MTKNHQPIHAIIPGLGLRSIKTALSVAILALIYLPFNANPTFACIGVIFGMGSDMDNSKKSGGNRLIGTIIGGFLAMCLFWIEHSFFAEGNYYVRVALTFVGIILLVCSSVIFKWPGAVQPGGVVLCIILFNTPSNHIAYAFGRMFDTAVGVIFALTVNAYFSRERIDRLLKRKTVKDNFKQL